jgi:hypothetical protein
VRAVATHHGCGWLEDRAKGKTKRGGAAAAALGFGKDGEV